MNTLDKDKDKDKDNRASIESKKHFSKSSIEVEIKDKDCLSIDKKGQDVVKPLRTRLWLTSLPEKNVTCCDFHPPPEGNLKPACITSVPFLENANKFQNSFRRPVATTVFLMILFLGLIFFLEKK